MTLDQVAVAIPAYQAAGSVGEVVRRSLLQLTEVLVVDDGSTDGTDRVARDSGARTLSHPRNLGKGRALATAFEDLFGRGYEFVITLDADGQHLPEEIPVLAQALGEAELVIGSRAHLFHAMGRVRRQSNRWSSRLISLAAGQRLEDVQCGFRLYTRPLIQTLGFPESGFDAESSIVVRAVRKGFRVRTVPIRMGFADGRSTSHYRPLLDSLRIARSVIKTRWETP